MRSDANPGAGCKHEVRMSAAVVIAAPVMMMNPFSPRDAFRQITGRITGCSGRNSKTVVQQVQQADGR